MTVVENVCILQQWLLGYFERKDSREGLDKTLLPDPEGPLSLKVPTSTIISANNEADSVLQLTTMSGPPDESRKRTRGLYDKFSPEEKAIIAHAAMDNGVTQTVNKYNKDLQERKLKKSTVQTWVQEYKRELQMRRDTAINLTSSITKLEANKENR